MVLLYFMFVFLYSHFLPLLFAFNDFNTQNLNIIGAKVLLAGLSAVLLVEGPSALHRVVGVRFDL